jgi:hypothetical protein
VESEVSWTPDRELVESLARRVMLIAMEHDVNVQRVRITIVDVLRIQNTPVEEAWISFEFIDPEAGVLGVTIKDEFKHHAERINAKLHMEIPRLRPIYGRTVAKGK